ncbi:MAG: hypothetical protein J0H83_19355 [Candidatus Melainabacteria bacterium]|jgi:hypothetical protein|nr:hypothetical protein [Candidatus Melainabacteria bacterium]
MDVINALGLLIIIFVAFGVMAGGRAPSLMRPAIRIVESLLTFALRGVSQVLGAVSRVGGGSVKLPGRRHNESGQKPGPPPTRWDE